MKKAMGIKIIFVVFSLFLHACGGIALETTTPPTQVPPPTQNLTIQHQTFPISASSANVYYDVESAATAPEKRAPYGDSYDINLFERPFLQDMTYVPDLDIRFFSLSEDEQWIYFSFKLTSSNPNNSLGINYGVEVDKNLDGYGDFIILATAPFTNDWATDYVKIYADNNTNTAGISPIRSDAPFSSDGYETLVFDGGQLNNSDPDIAWVRTTNETYATLQFAIKKTFIGPTFMYGVFADAGLKDISKFDYVDQFTEAEAGSPVRAKNTYPLKAVFAIDNTCWQAYGFQPNMFEPKICPEIVQPSNNSGNPDTPAGCPLTLAICQNQSYCNVDLVTCQCIVCG